MSRSKHAAIARTPSRRRGFLLWAVVGSLAVIGILVFALHTMARHQNAQAHRIYYGEVAQHLAEAGLEHVGRRIRDVLFTAPLPRGGVDLTSQNFFRVLLLDNARLKQVFDSQLGRESWLDQLLGRGWRYPLNVLLGGIPGSSLEVSLVAEPEPLVPDPVVADPVEKRVRLVLRSRAAHRGVVRSLEAGYEIKVVHPFPPVASKFTLFVSNAESGHAYDTYRNNPSGLPYTATDFSPLLFNHTPPQEVQDLTLIRENIPNEQTNPFVEMPQVREAISRRGYVYLGTGTGNREIHLDMTAGPVLSGGGGFGEFFHLFNPLPQAVGGFDASPAYFAVLNPPAYFRNPIPDTVHPGIFQQANINFLYWGFHYPDGTSNLRDGTLGAALVTESSSVLHLYGTHANPSRTKVFGNVMEDYIRFGYLACDRDVQEDDENTQRANLAAAGLPPFVRIRDTIDPTLRYAEESEFRDDLGRESAGIPPRVLSPIPAQVANRNFTIGGNVIDPGWPTVPLDPASYSYRNLFDGEYDTGGTDPGRNLGYSRFMSQVEPIPYNAILDYMYYGGVIPPESNPRFPGPTVEEGLAHYLDARDVVFSFRDPLHEALNDARYFRGALEDVFAPGATDYHSAVGKPPGSQSGVSPDRVLAPSPAATMALARTYREFLHAGEFLQEYYDATRNLLTIYQCVRIRNGDLSLPQDVRYVGSGLVVVMEGNIVSDGQVPIRDPVTGMDSALTLVALSGDLVFTDRLHQAAFVAPRGRAVAGGGRLLLEGTLAARELPPDELTGGGNVSYNGLYDPITDLREPNGTAYIDYYQIAMSDSPMDWRRVAK